MAEEFDYGALWSIAQDALNEVNALTGAILQLPSALISPWACRNPPPGTYEKWQAALKTLPERRAKAADAIRKAAKKLAKLLVEDRFIAPVAGVWPPSAPEIARRVSSGLGMAASAARAVIAWKDDAHIDQPKRSAVSAESTLRAVIAELERRADVAELAYQRQVEKLRAEHPDWSGADSTAKAAGGKPPEEPARFLVQQLEARIGDTEPEKHANGIAKGSTTSREKPAEYVFAKSGDGYDIAGFGEQGHFKISRGLEHLERLLKDAGRPVPMVELVGGIQDDRVDADHHSRQEVFDEEAKKELGEKLRELDEDIERAKTDHNCGEQDRLEKEKEKLISSFQAALGLEGRSRDMNYPTEKLRPRIYAALGRAYKALRKAAPPLSKLADHLEASISSEGATFKYAPTPLPDWSFD